MTETDIPEPDRIEGAPHPREALHVYGQDAAEQAFLDALNAHRLHHGWLLTGPRGVGKATLAWRIARALLAQPPADAGLFGEPEPLRSLDVAPDHPVYHRMAALSEPRFFLLRRAWDEKKQKLDTVISVDEVRRMKSFFNLSAADGGRRVAIVDAMDDMNVNAANALLKLLEEPPAEVTLLLISHQPARLLPTIRSRCRELRLGVLNAADMESSMVQAGAEAGAAAALAELSGGSVGAAIALSGLDGLALYARLCGLVASMPRLDRQAMLALADLAGQRGAAERFDLLLGLIDLLLARLARAGVTGAPLTEAAPGETALLARLSPDANAARDWANLAQTLGNRARQGKAVNLDPAALVIDMILKMDETASRVLQRA